MSESLLQDDELRFVDVLLEDVLLEGAPAAAASHQDVAVPRRTPWLTAAVITLGLGVLAFASWLQRVERVRLQDPAPGQELRRFVPKDAAGLAEFLRQVTRVRVQPLHAFGQDELREFRALPRGEADEAAVARLGPLLQGWDACSEVAPKEPLVRVRCFGADGRWLEARYVEPSCLFVGDAGWTPPPSGVRMLRELAEKAQQNLLATYARVQTPEALGALPATIEFLAVADISDEVLERELPRLRALRALHVDGLTDSLASKLRLLPVLRKLECSDNSVTEQGWASLAQIASLRDLRVFGALDALTPELLVKVGRQLTSLGLPGSHDHGFPVSARHLEVIRGFVGLEELCVAVDFQSAAGALQAVGLPEIDRAPEQLLAIFLEHLLERSLDVVRQLRDFFAEVLFRAGDGFFERRGMFLEDRIHGRSVAHAPVRQRLVHGGEPCVPAVELAAFVLCEQLDFPARTRHECAGQRVVFTL